MGIGAAPEGGRRCHARSGGHFQGQLVYDPAIAQTSEWADMTKEGNLERLSEMGISDPTRSKQRSRPAASTFVSLAAASRMTCSQWR